MFIALCERFGLYRFENIKENGLTYGNFFDLNFIADFIYMLFLWLPITVTALIYAQSKWQIVGIFINLIGYLGIVMFYDDHKIPGWKFWSSFFLWYAGAGLYWCYFDDSLVMIVFGILTLNIILVFVWFVFVALLYDKDSDTMRGEEVIQKLVKSIASAYIKSASLQRLLNSLFPNKVDYTKDDSVVQVKVSFAQVNKKFTTRLSKLIQAGFKPLTARQSKAIIPEAIIIDKSQTIKNFSEHIERSVDFNQILYTLSKNGNFVDIIAQSGNFQDEQEVIDWVKQEGIQKINFN
jgi:hypothetical protein